MTDVTLMEIDREVARAVAEGDASFELRYAARLGENAERIRDVIRQALTLLTAVSRDPPWGGYLAVDRDSRYVVGTCAFKTGPREDGVVEIAYFTFPQFEGRGFATAMARELLAIAQTSPDVRTVIAHTLPEKNASTRALERAGMQWAGEVDDPEDGRVWRWSCTTKP